MPCSIFGQRNFELNKNWRCRNVRSIVPTMDGRQISERTYTTLGWLDADVPGTVLGSLIKNKLFPDPYFGLNNEKIPDIYTVGKDYYTYWFINDFEDSITSDGEQVWLNFRGVNYSFKAYLNGHEITDSLQKGMFLRHSFNITQYIAKNGKNRLAVIVYPPDPAGNPNGGQGGDGTIAKSVTNQYVAGWDWIQPVRDRNTGIWDKVTVEHTGRARIKNPHIITIVPGVRHPEQTKQAPATLKVSTEIEYTGAQKTERVVRYTINGKAVEKKVSLAPNSTTTFSLPDYIIQNPKLWWPNGYGMQSLYKIKLQVLVNGQQVSDEQEISFGVREIKGVWNKTTKSREVHVNGQKIFIKGGNWIASDAMLRLTAQRYDVEIRMHRDMNLNLIRVWGGSLTERPEFYDACDKYGLLVMQDFWVSGDCNGRWYDAFKKDDTLTRRTYPDDHKLFIQSIEDQIKMLRSHPSLAIWCGGNEITPPKDILEAMKYSLLPKLDGTRIFFDYSNHDSMSYNSHDGPYSIQTERSFFENRSFAFNSEIGSVGLGDFESLERIMPVQNMIAPRFDKQTGTDKIDSVWQYHKYKSYDTLVDAYGVVTNTENFCKKAQMVNYNQYRALMEGFCNHEWDWYTGVIIWKTQNPWTAMLGQMYDTYLDPNACLYGLSEGAKPVHIFYDPVSKSVKVANNSLQLPKTLKMSICVYDTSGKQYTVVNKHLYTTTNGICEVYKAGNTLDSFSKRAGSFVNMVLTDSANGYQIDENFYWLPDATGKYSGIAGMREANVKTNYKIIEPGIAELTIENPAENPVAFFIRVSLTDPKTRKRILPVLYSDNYVSVLPGKYKKILMEYKTQTGTIPWATIDGWNVKKQYATTLNKQD